MSKERESITFLNLGRLWAVLTDLQSFARIVWANMGILDDGILYWLRTEGNGMELFYEAMTELGWKYKVRSGKFLCAELKEYEESPSVRKVEVVDGKLHVEKIRITLRRPFRRGRWLDVVARSGEKDSLSGFGTQLRDFLHKHPEFFPTEWKNLLPKNTPTTLVFGDSSKQELPVLDVCVGIQNPREVMINKEKKCFPWNPSSMEKVRGNEWLVCRE